MSFLKITDLYKSYGNVSVLKDINIEIEEGGFLVLVGPSGCGKSTLLNTIAGLEPITSGDISINGRSVSGLHPSQRDIAMVFQSYALYPNMTVGGNIAFGMEIRKVPKPERDKAIQEVADILQIGHLLDRKPAFRRPASARCDGARACSQSAGLPVRRTIVQSGRQAARGYAYRDQASASPHEDDNRLCDA